MATKVTRDHHLLSRNLKLNGNYLSNDGDDEGISIANDGNVIINGDTKLYLNDAGGEYLNSNGDDLTITAGRDLIIESGRDVKIDTTGQLQIDKDINNTTAAANSPGIHLDYDRIGSVTTGTDTNVGFNFDISVTGAGTSGTPTINTTGIDMDVVGDAAGSGTSKNTGIDINCSGADNNYGMNITVPAVTGDYHIKLIEGDNPTDYVTLAIDNNGICQIIGTNTGTAWLKLDFDLINLKANGSYVNFQKGVTTHGHISMLTSNVLKLVSSNNYDLSLEAQGAGNVILNPDNGVTKFYDGGDATEFASITVVGGTGGTTIATASEAADGHLTFAIDGHIDMGKATGFAQITASYDATDTDIDFRDGNKQILTLTGNIVDVHFQFPAVSGNFLCIFLQDGTGGWDVSNWKTKDAAGNAGAGNSGVVKWAGGSATTLTETADKADIISIYWDATNEMAYAVASENF